MQKQMNWVITYNMFCEVHKMEIGVYFQVIDVVNGVNKYNKNVL